MSDSDETSRLVIDEREESDEEMRRKEESNNEREEGELRDDDDDDEEEEEEEGVMDEIEEEEEEEEEGEEVEYYEDGGVDVIMMEDGDEEEEGEGDERAAGSRMTLRPHSESKPSTSSADLLYLSTMPPCSSSTAASSSTSTTLLMTSSSSMLPPSGVSGVPTSSASTTTSTSSMGGIGVGAGGGGVHGNSKRMQWSMGDMMQLYEAIKQYGKDFDALHRVMAKRKIEINKDQLRNFFFNFYKQVRTGADMKEEDWPSELSRDARDLFTVINGCEWRKRMGTYKFEPARLKALIMEGSTVTRVRCKKQHVTIKTPCCPALLQFFSFNRRITRFPPDIVLYLSPKTYRDESNVLSRRASPNLCIRLNTCDRVERVFDLLHLKWKQVVMRDDDDDEEYEADEEREEREIRPFTIKLYPSRRTAMGEITYTPSPSSFCNVSINMLQEDRSKTENIKRQIKRGSDLSDPCYQVAQSLIPLLSITRASLAAGVTRTSVRNASVAELYAVCGMCRSIDLLYAIEDDASSEVDEPWDILADLITRGYGEAVTDKKPSLAGVIKTPSRDEKPPVMPPPSKRPRVMNPMPSASASRAKTASYYVQQAPIVSAEMDEFAEQLRTLQSAPRQKRRSPMRLNNKTTMKRPNVPSIPSTPSSYYSARSSGTCTPTHKTPPQPWRSNAGADSFRPGSRTRMTSAASTPGRMPSSLRTTFPQMASASSSSSAGTPHQHHMSSMTKMTATGDDTLALALNAAFTSPENSLHEAPSTSRGVHRSVQAAFFSPTKTNASLPFDVRASLEQVMTQNSVDFFNSMEFDRLICTTTDATSSPTKLSRL